MHGRATLDDQKRNAWPLYEELLNSLGFFSLERLLKCQIIAVY